MAQGSTVGPQELRRTFHLLIRRFGLLDGDRTPCGHPLPISQAHALMELMQRPGTKQGDLSLALGLSKSAVSRMVTQLEKRGFVERRSSAKDERVRYLSLTVKGRKAAEAVDRSSIDRFAAVLGGIPPEAHVPVLEALDILQRAIPVQSETSEAAGDDG